MSKELQKEIGERIRSLRRNKEYNGEEVAFQAGISVKYLYEIERGKRNLSAEKIVDLANVLNTSCDYILLGKLKEDIESEK